MKLKYANGLLVGLHVDTETDMYFLEAMFVKEVAWWCPAESNTREYNKRPLPLTYPYCLWMSAGWMGCTPMDMPGR